MKRLMKNILVLASLLAASSLFAQGSGNQGVDLKNTGQATMNFLQVSVVPKAIAMGDAYTAIGTGVESIFYNPAGLTEMDNKVDLFFSMTNWIADIKYFAGAAAWRLGNIGTVGVSLVHVDYGDIIGTSLISVADIANDELGYRETGSVSNVGAYAIGLAYSRRVTDTFVFGLSARYAGQQLGQSLLAGGMKDNNESSVVFDLGVKYYTPVRGFRFGMSIRNFSNAVKYEEITASLPLTFSVGGAIDVLEMLQGDRAEGESSLLASVEFSHPNNYTERLHMGLDYSLMGFLSARVGYVTNHDVAGLSLGVGILPELMGTKAEISYTYSSMDIFDDVSRFSVKFGL